MSAPMAPNTSASNTRIMRNTRTTGKGSVSKRRGPLNPKVDRDGDLNMESSISANASLKPKRSKSGITKSSPAGSNRSSKKPRPAGKVHQMAQRILGSDDSPIARVTGNRRTDAVPPMTLMVEGLKASKVAANAGGGLKELLSFLERKAQNIGNTSRHIRIKKSQIRGDFVYITANKEDAEEILKVNNFTFAGATLKITTAPDGIPAPLSSHAQEVKTQLLGVLGSRYDHDAKLLNLSAMGGDPNLINLGFFNGEASPEKLFRALMAVCDGLFKTAQEKRDAVVSISLAGNDITDVEQIKSLSDTFPDIVNLDLSHNKFQSLQSLQAWRSRLPRVQAILLNDNPIEMANPNYHGEFVSWFPQLLNLNGIQVRTPEQVAAALRITPIPQFGADFRDASGVGEAFLTEFFALYDSDRINLASKYYDEASTFSLAVNTQAVHEPNVPLPSWGSYIKFSRNHTKIGYLPTRQQRLLAGVTQIQQLWKQLPATRHPNVCAQQNQYRIDCHPVQGLLDPSGQSPSGVDGLCLIVNGEFEDQEAVSMKTSKRSFTRTIVLGPGAPGKHPIRVVSDMLSLRTFVGLPATDADQLHEQMLLELCKQTGMTAEYSRLCLQGANWIFDQALASFHEKRAQLPVDAFTTL